MRNIKRSKDSNSSDQDYIIVTNIINIKNCVSSADILNYFESAAIDKGLQSAEDILVFKVQFDDYVHELDLSCVKELNKKYVNKSVVVQIESKDDGKFRIFGKSKDIEEFLELEQPKKLNLEAEQKLNGYIVDFLVKSLKNEHLGMYDIWIYTSTILTGISKYF